MFNFTIKIALTFFAGCVNNAYLLQKIKSSTEKHKDKSHLKSYHPGMQLNFDVGKEENSGLSLGTEPYHKKTLGSTGSQNGKLNRNQIGF